MSRRYLLALIATASMFLSAPGFAQKADSNSLSPEALSAKSLLEDLLVKRYSQDLSTKVQKDLYSIGSQIELTARPEEKDNKKNEYEIIDDLSLGAIDPDSLMKKLSGSEANEAALNILKQFKIKSVQLAVGLDPQLGDEKKQEVQTWLDERLKKEFAKNAKGDVTFIKRAEPHVSGFLDLLKNFENLAGQIVMALALLIGALVWGLLASKKGSDKGDGASVTVNNQSDGKGLGAESALAIEKRLKEQETLTKEVGIITEKLVGLLPRISANFEGVLRSWCQQGEAGRVRLVCFAEAVGKDIGKLPIPVDAVSDVSKVFSKMMHMSLKEKKEALEKAYWDFLAVLNLGSESLNQPFSYIGGLNVDTVNEVLIEQNPKMRTLVTLYMPDDLRTKYISSLDTETKRQILQSATDLNEIPVAELKAVDGAVSTKVKSRGKSGDGVVQLEMTLQKVVSVLSPFEKATMLKDLEGPGLALFKRTTPCLAFLHEWPDDALAKLVARSNVDELVTFSRVREDVKDRLIAAAPPMTAEMAKDELGRPDTTSDNDKARLLTNLEGTIQALIDEKELDLEVIFSQTNASGTTKIASAA